MVDSTSELTNLYIVNTDFRKDIVIYAYIVPYILWGVMIYYFMYNRLFTSFLSLDGLILCIPLLAGAYNLAMLLVTPHGIGHYVQPCYESKVTTQQKKNNILGVFDIKCMNGHSELYEDTVKALTERFYGLSYTLFMMMLIVQNTFDKKDVNLVVVIALALLLSIIGSATTQWFQWASYDTLLALHVSTNILEINISMVIYVLLYLGKKFLDVKT